MKYGIWIARADQLGGWMGLAVPGKLSPLVFTKEEADAQCALLNAYRTDGELIEVRPNPPDELPWNEGEWQKRQEPA